MSRTKPDNPAPEIENLKRCVHCKALSPFVSDTTYGGYKYCDTCGKGLELEPVTREMVEAAWAVARAAAIADQHLAVAMDHFREVGAA